MKKKNKILVNFSGSVLIYLKKTCKKANRRLTVGREVLNNKLVFV